MNSLRIILPILSLVLAAYAQPPQPGAGAPQSVPGAFPQPAPGAGAAAGDGGVATAVEPKKPKKPFGGWFPFTFPWGQGHGDKTNSASGNKAAPAGQPAPPPQDPEQPHILPHPWSPNGGFGGDQPGQPRPPPGPKQPSPPFPGWQNGGSNPLAKAISNRIAQFLRQAEPVEREFVKEVIKSLGRQLGGPPQPPNVHPPQPPNYPPPPPNVHPVPPVPPPPPQQPGSGSQFGSGGRPGAWAHTA